MALRRHVAPGVKGEGELIRQLHATLGKLELALGAVRDGIVWTDPRGVIQWCNAGADRMMRRPHIELLGAPFEDSLPLWQGGAPVNAAHPARLAAEDEPPVPRRYALGPARDDAVVEPTWARVEVSGRRDIVFVLRDVTELARREDSLALSEYRYRLAVENVTDYAVFTLDEQGRILTWNEGAARINGYRAEEVLGRHFSLLLPEKAQAAEELRATAASGRHEYEGWRRRKDGSLYWANDVVTAIRDGAGRVRGFSKITRDLSERKRMEDALLNAKLAAEASNSELEAFCYSVAHDLRAPLRGIDGFGGLLARRLGPALDPHDAGLLARIRRETTRMGRLIDDLLALSRVTRAPMRREPVDLSALAREVGEAQARAEPAREVAFTAAGGLNDEGNPDLLRQVLENLLGNAWKYTRKHASARVAFGAESVGGRPAYFVRDDGAGFDMAHAKKLFQAFSRLHSPGEFEGTGIGLAIVKRVVERHGGRVWAEGAVERGATFYFTLWEDRT